MIDLFRSPFLSALRRTFRPTTRRLAKRAIRSLPT